MTAQVQQVSTWSQPDLFELLDEPIIGYTCHACGTEEPNEYNMGKHGGIHARPICLHMSTSRAVLETYIRSVHGEKRFHCCTHVFKIPSHNYHQDVTAPTTTEQRIEHVLDAYERTQKLWAKQSGSFHQRLIEVGMNAGLTPHLVARILVHAPYELTPYKTSFESDYCQDVTDRQWQREHTATDRGDLMSCSCGHTFTPHAWTLHEAGYPTLKGHDS